VERRNRLNPPGAALIRDGEEVTDTLSGMKESRQPGKDGLDSCSFKAGTTEAGKPPEPPAAKPGLHGSRAGSGSCSGDRDADQGKSTGPQRPRTPKKSTSASTSAQQDATGGMAELFKAKRKGVESFEKILTIAAFCLTCRITKSSSRCSSMRQSWRHNCRAQHLPDFRSGED
jgi:hypothetical protein